MDARPKINALANQVCSVQNSLLSGCPVWVSCEESCKDARLGNSKEQLLPNKPTGLGQNTDQQSADSQPTGYVSVASNTCLDVVSPY